MSGTLNVRFVPQADLTAGAARQPTKLVLEKRMGFLQDNRRLQKMPVKPPADPGRPEAIR